MLAGRSFPASGFGAGIFPARLRTILPLPQAHERAGLAVSFYVEAAYLSSVCRPFSRGPLAPVVGLTTAGRCLCAAVIPCSRVNAPRSCSIPRRANLPVGAWRLKPRVTTHPNPSRDAGLVCRRGRSFTRSWTRRTRPSRLFEWGSGTGQFFSQGWRGGPAVAARHRTAPAALARFPPGSASGRLYFRATTTGNFLRMVLPGCTILNITRLKLNTPGACLCSVGKTGTRGPARSKYNPQWNRRCGESHG